MLLWGETPAECWPEDPLRRREVARLLVSMKLEAGSGRAEARRGCECVAAWAVGATSKRRAADAATSAGPAKEKNARRAHTCRGRRIFMGVLEAAKPPEPFQTREPARCTEVALRVPSANGWGTGVENVWADVDRMKGHEGCGGEVRAWHGSPGWHVDCRQVTTVPGQIEVCSAARGGLGALYGSGCGPEDGRGAPRAAVVCL